MIESRQETVTIATDGTISTVIDFQGYTMLAIQVETMVGTTIGLMACATEDGTFKDVYDDAGAIISIAVVDDVIIGLDAIAGKIAALPFVKFKSGSTETSEVDIIVYLQR